MFATPPAEVTQDFLQHLHAVTSHLPDWLEARLVDIDPRWWENLVLSSLTYHQREKVERTAIENLSRLDLAALLRVLDQNWFNLASRLGFTSQDRHYVKEMQTIRNRWAHLDAHGISADDLFRDIDTLQRFARLVDLPAEKSETLAAMKRRLIATESGPIPQGPTIPAPAKSGTVSDLESIGPGTMVNLVSDPAKQGVVTTVDGAGAQARFNVYLDGRLQPFYRSQLRVCQVEDSTTWLSVSELHAALTAMNLNHPTRSSLYSLHAARIDFVPYQFRPALKIIRADQPRLLVADGVGVGKTIEAGLIIKELQARSNLESILIICPKPLIAERKWEMEMKRFDERFVPLDGPLLRRCLDEMDEEGIWPEAYRKAIIPFSLLDEKLIQGQKSGKRPLPGLIDLSPPPRFDLVIVDEAHHARNASTLVHQAVQYFCDRAEAVVFLTATPIQLGNQDLFTLLNLLRPDLVIDREAFERMAEPNPAINRALRHIRSGSESWQKDTVQALRAAASTSWGRAILAENPEFGAVLARLDERAMSRDERVALIRTVESFHSFARLINRTRRRDIDTFCIRKPETVEVAFTPAQQELHDALLAFEAEALSRLHASPQVKFMMTTLRRQAASCIFGLAPLLSTILGRRLGIMEWSEVDGDEVPDDSSLQALSSRASTIQALARTLSKDDPKFDRFWEVLSAKLGQTSKKTIVFSSFRHTLAYLYARLAEKGVRAGLIHGDVSDDERRALRERFAGDGPDALDVMLFSEVGGEGLDYQFCDTMINYDLPWNPMRIEQRIGRIDRRGQKSDVVLVYNMITSGTIEADIYERCLKRIGIFEDSIGDCEEILGEIHEELRSIAETASLSDAERKQKLDQLADNEIRKVQEFRELEKQQHELFGVLVPELTGDDEVKKSDNPWIGPMALQRLVSRYLQERMEGPEHLLGDRALKSLRLSVEGRSRLLEDFRGLDLRKNPVNRAWEVYLKGGEAHHAITFDPGCATEERAPFFITPMHPLVLQAARHLTPVDPVYVSLRVSDPDASAGRYLFAIYSWERRGLLTELEFVPICEDARIADSLFRYLEEGIDLDLAGDRPTSQDFQALDQVHHATWEHARKAFSLQVSQVCTFKKESLKTSHAARLRVLRDQRDRAGDDKIHRMRKSQIENIELDFDRQIRDLDRIAGTVDIHARPVVFGVVTVEA